MEAILFASVLTATIGYPFARLFSYIWDWLFPPSEVIDDHEPTSREIRESPEYRAWVIAVKKRDGFQCIYCHSEYNLEAHHIYSFASFPELRFDTFNGLTVCRDCHKLTPNYGSKEKAFSQQLKAQ